MNDGTVGTMLSRMKVRFKVNRPQRESFSPEASCYVQELRAGELLDERP